MTVHKYYIGGMGPYLYDDTVSLLDPDGDFPGENQHGLITDGQVKVDSLPTESADVLRLEDIGDLISGAVKVVSSISSTGTINYITNIIFCSGTFDIFLPTLANGENRVYTIKNVSSGVITLKPNATEALVEIDWEVSQPLNEGDSVTVFSDSSDWWVI